MTSKSITFIQSSHLIITISLFCYCCCLGFECHVTEQLVRYSRLDKKPVNLAHCWATINSSWMIGLFSWSRKHFTIPFYISIVVIDNTTFV
ncbi:hypothetical protein BC941DRAFT_428238, partial [Chlamydoabsidia padenii]